MYTRPELHKKILVSVILILFPTNLIWYLHRFFTNEIYKVCYREKLFVK